MPGPDMKLVLCLVLTGEATIEQDPSGIKEAPKVDYTIKPINLSLTLSISSSLLASWPHLMSHMLLQGSGLLSMPFPAPTSLLPIAAYFLMLCLPLQKAFLYYPTPRLASLLCFQNTLDTCLQ